MAGRRPRGDTKRSILGKRGLEEQAGPSDASSSSGGASAAVYAKGAIRRLKMHNFLTFDDMEIRPSPYLNVIVGPNGTGKSSIVCGICLALGGLPSILGRAKELKDFIKHGTQEGYVEIELHNDRGRNPVIRRYLTKTSSLWQIHGKTVQAKEVKRQVDHMRIHLQNKCQFLPQDMVVEFAKLNSYQLLEETEKAIGDVHLYENHKKLMSMKSDEATDQKKLRMLQAELETEVKRNQLLERDVHRFRDLQGYRITIEQLKMKRCWVEYQECRDEFVRRKASRKEAEKSLKILHHHYKPIKDKHREQEIIVKRMAEDEQTQTQSLRLHGQQLERRQQKLLDLEEELVAPRRDLQNKKREEQERRKRTRQLQQEIQSFKAELESLEDPEITKPQIVERTGRIREIVQVVDELTEQQRTIELEKKQYSDQIRAAEDELGRMQDVRNQRLQHIRRMDRETYDAIMWLRDNQQRFQQPIIEPVMLVLNVKDPQYCKQVEAFFRGKDALSFITQNKSDYDAFLAEIRDRQKLRVNVVRAPPGSMADIHPPFTLESIRGYGFQHMLMDIVDAPEPTLRYFCKYNGLHTVPIADTLSPAQIQQIIRDLRPVHRFFTSTSTVSVKRIIYGNKVNTRDSDLRPAVILSTSVDSQRMLGLREVIREAQSSLGVFQEQYSVLERRNEELRKEDARLRTEKKKLQDKLTARKKVITNISSRETKLKQQQDASFDLKAEEEKCEEAVEGIQQERVECVCDLHTVIKKCVNAAEKKEKACLLARGSKLKVTFLLRQHNEAKTIMDNAQMKLTSLEQQEKKLKDDAHRLLSKAKEVSGGLQSPDANPDLVEAFNEFPNTLDEIEVMIHERQTSADMCTGTDDQVVAEYEERAEKIDSLRDRVESLDDKISGHTDSMKALKESWLEPLKELLRLVNEKFKFYFGTMQCAGEVHLQEDEDFSKYGIDIRVMFRGGESLQRLNAQRQSGGERSVATMLYLLSLQGIASCPFRVVDEINQGMDPENERRVFDLIVASASAGAQECSQYFILTPKLLRDLNYSESVTVHVVCNGPEMLPFQQWDIDKFLQ